MAEKNDYYIYVYIYIWLLIFYVSKIKAIKKYIVLLILGIILHNSNPCLKVKYIFTWHLNRL